MSLNIPQASRRFWMALGLVALGWSVRVDAAPRPGALDRARKGQGPAAGAALNDLSMEVEALRSLHRFQMTREQMSSLRSWAADTAQKRSRRQPARASADYRRALQALHAALVRGEDDERIAALEDRLEEIADDSEPDLDDDVDITLPARRRAPEAYALLTRAQVTRFLELSEEDLEPGQALVRAIDRAGKLDAADWQEFAEETVVELSGQLGGADLDRARSAGARVASWLRTLRGLSEQERRTKRADLEKAAQEIVAGVPAARVRENVATHALAALLSNPRLAAAIDARLKK